MGISFNKRDTMIKSYCTKSDIRRNKGMEKITQNYNIDIVTEWEPTIEISAM